MSFAVWTGTFFDAAGKVLTPVPSSQTDWLPVASAEVAIENTFSILTIVSGIKVIPAPSLCQNLDEDNVTRKLQVELWLSRLLTSPPQPEHYLRNTFRRSPLSSNLDVGAVASLVTRDLF